MNRCRRWHGTVRRQRQRIAGQKVLTLVFLSIFVLMMPLLAGCDDDSTPARGDFSSDVSRRLRSSVDHPFAIPPAPDTRSIAPPLGGTSAPPAPDGLANGGDSLTGIPVETKPPDEADTLENGLVKKAEKPPPVAPLVINAPDDTSGSALSDADTGDFSRRLRQNRATRKKRNKLGKLLVPLHNGTF